MAHRLLHDPDQDGWERSDFPIVCETCLGPNPYVRMQRIEFGGTCHISGRPYTVFRWRPGNDARYKKTIVCQDVAKAKNVCQVCLLDLDYGLPVQVRDSALGIQDDDLPESEVGKEYQLNERAKAGEVGSSYSQQRPNDLILQLQRTTPYYKRNRAAICSFFVKGECNRGAECPYRHEMPTTGELADQNIRDRYYGNNDPVANKMLRRVADLPQLQPPDDQSITTLYVGGLVPGITEDDIKDQFYSFGEIKSIKKVDTRNCAFVTFTTREAADKATQELHNKLIIKGSRCRVDWGRPHVQGGRDVTSASLSMAPPQAQQQQQQAVGAAPAPSTEPNFFDLPAADPQAAYPSMDPSAMGSRSGAGASASRAPTGDEPDSKRPRVFPTPPSHPNTGPPYPPGPRGGQPPAPGGRPQHLPPPVPMPMGMPPMGMPPPLPRPPPPMGPPAGGSMPPPHPRPPSGPPPPQH